jgi:hypothetical protein
LLKEGGLSQGAIARLVGRAQSTVSSVAAQEGLSAPRHRTPVHANYARKVYAKEQRRKLHDKFLSLTEAQVDGGQMTPREMRELAQAIAIVTEKRRLEEDEAGSTKKTCSGSPHHFEPMNLQEEFKRLDELQRQQELSEG